MKSGLLWKQVKLIWIKKKNFVFWIMFWMRMPASPFGSALITEGYDKMDAGQDGTQELVYRVINTNLW
jgi:hypothetical protein